MVVRCLVHDELQTYVDPEYAKQFEKLSLDGMRKTFDDVRKFSVDAEPVKVWEQKYSVRSMDFGSKPGFSTLTLGEYEIRLRSLNDVASRIADHWVRRREEMISNYLQQYVGNFADNEY